MEAPPHPFAYAHKDVFFELSLEDKPPHIWECLQYLEWRRGEGDLPESDIDAQVVIMNHIAQDVAKHLASELRQQGAWKDQYDPRWPRYHPESKHPLYLTGCYPPLLLCLEDRDDQWRDAATDASLREMADWLMTPAGQHGLTEEDRVKASSDIEVYERAREAESRAWAELQLSRERLDRAREKYMKLLDQLGQKPPPPDKKKPLD